MNIINILLFIGLSTLLGFLLFIKFNSFSKSERLGNSILVGLFLSTILVLCDYIIFENFSSSRLLQYLLLSNVIFLLVQKNNLLTAMKAFRFKKISFNKSHALILCILGLYLFSTILINYLWPINDWDSIALYDFRAKLMQYGTWEPGIELGYFFHYPPFTSILHGMSYLLGFKQVKIFYSLMFIAYLFVFFGLLSKRLSKKLSLLGVLILSFAPLTSGHILIAYTNLPYTIFFSLGTIYSLEWIVGQKNSSLYLTMIYLAASFWVRSAEPFWIIPLFLMFISQIISKKRFLLKSWIPSLLFLVGMYYFWPTYVNSLNLPKNVINTYDNKIILNLSASNILYNIFSVTQYLFKYFILPLGSLLIPFIYIVIFDRSIIKKKYLMLQLLTIGLFSAMVFGGTFYFSFTFETWNQIGGSVQRMIMFFEPMIIFFIMHSPMWFIDD